MRGFKVQWILLPALVVVGTYLLVRQGYIPLNVTTLFNQPSGHVHSRGPMRTTEVVTNIRVQPNIRAPVIGKNQPGEVVQALEAEGDWQKVRFHEGRIGYIFKSLLKPVDPAPRSGEMVAGDCDKGYEAPGDEYRVMGNAVNVREGPGTVYRVLRENKSGGVNFLQLHNEMRVRVECIDGSWSRMRVVNPIDQALSHHGWTSRRYLGPVKGGGGDLGISAIARAPYRKNSFSGENAQFLTRLPDIEDLRLQAAESLLDTGQCVRVDSSELSVRSTLENLIIMVDCRNGRRFYFDETELSARQHADSESENTSHSVTAGLSTHQR